MKPPALEYDRPETLAGALAALAAAEAMPIAGGQSLVPMLSLRLASPARLIDLSRVPALGAAESRGDTVRLGALTTHAAIEDGRVPDPSLGMMPAVAGGIAYRAVRNFGTLGGAVALADPAADWPACLLALDATVCIAGPNGERSVPMDAFLIGPYTTALEPGEIIVAFEIPRMGPQARWGWQKLARKQGAYADSLAAAIFPGNGRAPRVTLGGTQNRAVLLGEVAAALAPDSGPEEPGLDALIANAVRAAVPDADAYQLRCHAAMVARAIAQVRRQ
jgi:carbon-monoxide dehydrogenase medium subunit